MIPRHRPPFGMPSLLKTAATSILQRQDVLKLESGYQQSLEVKHAIWIPSARWAIARTIQSHTASDAKVVCPVFNCGAVHHAVSESGRTVDYRDCAADSFLMNCSGAASPNHAVVLSEIFGHRFSSDALAQPLVADAAVRIFDLAMGIPTADDMRRMRSGDVTVLSFGLGKSLYAGWGGMASTHCDETAGKLRRRRDDELRAASVLRRTRWNTSMLLRMVAHEPTIYRWLRARSQKSGDSAVSAPAPFSATSHEWHRPPTALHIARSHQNLKASHAWAEQRRQMAYEYHLRLGKCSLLLSLPVVEAAAGSHFSIRVPATLRDTLRSRLWDDGIDAATLFPFPHDWCEAETFPMAVSAAAEVLNLPLSNQLQQRDVVRICDVVKRTVAELDAKSIAQKAAA